MKRLMMAISLAGIILSPGTARADTSAAEYAVRWNPKEGGPESAQAVARLFSIEVKDKDLDRYEVRYLVMSGQPADTPVGFKAILRERIKNNKKFELALKYRGNSPLPAAPDLEHDCPLPGKTTAKDEIDITLLSGNEVRRVYSRSCKTKNDDPIVVPTALKATYPECASKITRIEKDDLTVEEWRLPDNTAMIEVSQKGDDSMEHFNGFKTEVFDKLVNAQIKPLDRSKTELGSSCPADTATSNHKTMP